MSLERQIGTDTHVHIMSSMGGARDDAIMASSQSTEPNMENMVATAIGIKATVEKLQVTSNRMEKTLGDLAGAIQSLRGEVNSSINGTLTHQAGGSATPRGVFGQSTVTAPTEGLDGGGGGPSRSRDENNDAAACLVSYGAVSLAKMQIFIYRGMRAAKAQPSAAVGDDTTGSVLGGNFLEEFLFTNPKVAKKAALREGSDAEREVFLRQSVDQVLREIAQRVVMRPVTLYTDAIGSSPRVGPDNTRPATGEGSLSASRQHVLVYPTLPSAKLQGQDESVHLYSVGRFSNFVDRREPRGSARWRAGSETRTAVGAGVRSNVRICERLGPAKTGLEILDDVHAILYENRRGDGGLLQQLSEYASYIKISPASETPTPESARRAGFIERAVTTGRARDTSVSLHSLAAIWVASLTRLVFESDSEQAAVPSSSFASVHQNKRAKKSALRIMETNEAKSFVGIIKAVRMHVRGSLEESRNAIRVMLWAEVGSRIYACVRQRAGYGVELGSLPEEAETAEQIMLPDFEDCKVLPNLPVSGQVRPRLRTAGGTVPNRAEAGEFNVPDDIRKTNADHFDSLKASFPLSITFHTPVEPSNRPVGVEFASPLNDVDDPNKPPAHIMRTDYVDFHDLALMIICSASGLHGMDEVLACDKDALRFMHTVAVSLWAATADALRQAVEEVAQHESGTSNQYEPDSNITVPDKVGAEDSVLGSIRMFGQSKSAAETRFRSDLVPLILVRHLPWEDFQPEGGLNHNDGIVSLKERREEEDKHYLQKEKITAMSKNNMNVISWSDFDAMWRDRCRRRGTTAGSGVPSESEGGGNVAEAHASADPGVKDFEKEWGNMENEMHLL